MNLLLSLILGLLPETLYYFFMIKSIKDIFVYRYNDTIFIIYVTIEA